MESLVIFGRIVCRSPSSSGCLQRGFEHPRPTAIRVATEPRAVATRSYVQPAVYNSAGTKTSKRGCVLGSGRYRSRFCNKRHSRATVSTSRASVLLSLGESHLLNDLFQRNTRGLMFFLLSSPKYGQIISIGERFLNRKELFVGQDDKLLL